MSSPSHSGPCVVVDRRPRYVFGINVSVYFSIEARAWSLSNSYHRDGIGDNAGGKQSEFLRVCNRGRGGKVVAEGQEEHYPDVLEHFNVVRNRVVQQAPARRATARLAAQ